MWRTGIFGRGYKTAKMKKRPRNLEVEFNSQRGIKFIYPAWAEFVRKQG